MDSKELTKTPITDVFNARSDQLCTFFAVDVCAEEGSDALLSTVLCTLLLSLFLPSVNPPGAGAPNVLEPRSTTAVPSRLRDKRT